MTFESNLDPELADILQLLATVSLPTSAEQIRPFVDAEAAQIAARPVAANPDVVATDHTVPGGTLTLRMYRPTGSQAVILPVVYWIHGGGFIAGSVTADDPYCAALVAGTGAAVVSVEYRRPPDHAYPAPLDDCYAGLAWLAGNADALAIDPSRIAVAGASAGGGLAAGTVLRARDEGGPAIVFQYLMYPMIDDRDSTPSTHEFEELPVWDRANNRMAWAAYLGEIAGSDRVPAYAAPARATDLGGLPPTLIQVGELDVFRDEDIDYAVRMLRAGVSTQLHVFPGAYHGFELANPASRATARVYEERDEAIRRALGASI
jgi:acetyl esterase/lipase